MQVMEIDTKEPNSIQPKINHYKYMKLKVNSQETKEEKDESHDCLVEWDEIEDKAEKFTTPISVLAHYKKYTMKERKIILKKPDREILP